MVQGMAFLSKKGFNPQNNANRKLVWEAQQHSKHEKERLRKRQEQLKREQEDQELELATRGEIGGSQAQLRFMYDAPPGMEKDNKNINGNLDTGSNSKKNIPGKSNDDDNINDLARVKPGDDAAAVAFRQMLAATTSNGKNIGYATHNSDDDMLDKGQDSINKFKFTPSLQGSMVEADSRYNNPGELKGDDANKKSKALKDSRSALEKEVGRKNRSSQNNLSYEQQIERFPQLKNAPMAVKRGTTTAADGNDEAGTSAPMMVHFKPLGSQILHVRCLACGIWGHARGDRECKKSGWNPFALPSSTSKMKGLDTTTTTSSSTLPSKHGDSVKRNESSRSNELKESSSPEAHGRRRRSRRRFDSDSDSDDSERRRQRRHRRRRRDDSSDDDDYFDDDNSRTHDRRRNKYGRHHYKEYRTSRESSRSNPSSEDSSKLKRRSDSRYDSSEDERRNRRRDHRNQEKERYRDREHSKKRSRSKRYEYVSSHKKKKKRRRHHSP